MRHISFHFFILCKIVLIYLQATTSFHIGNAKRRSCFYTYDRMVPFLVEHKKELWKKYKIQKGVTNQLEGLSLLSRLPRLSRLSHLVVSPSVSLHCSYYNENSNERKREITDESIKEQLKNTVKEIQGVWKFYLPMFVMDTEFEEAKEPGSDTTLTKGKEENVEKWKEKETDKITGNIKGRGFINDREKQNSPYNRTDRNDPLNDIEEEFDVVKEDRDMGETVFKKDKLNTDVDEPDMNDPNLNILRGERLFPLPLFVYDYENIYSASDSTYAYWYNRYKYKNIYECTIKLVSKMNDKYMIILQGYLFVSPKNSLKDENIQLKPSQVFGNLFLAVNDSPNEKSLIPPNAKIYDKKGNEVTDILSILEKKIPGFRKDKKKIERFLGVKKWKYLGISTAYKTVGEGNNVFHIDHILSGNDDNVFYNILDFDTINNDYKKKNVHYLKDIFNSFFEQPSAEVLSLITKQLQEKSINGPF